MDQLIFASLSHTHYWYEVDMLKVSACTLPYPYFFSDNKSHVDKETISMISVSI